MICKSDFILKIIYSEPVWIRREQCYATEGVSNMSNINYSLAAKLMRSASRTRNVKRAELWNADETVLLAFYNNADPENEDGGLQS